jgi:hypothetical protein
MRPYTWTRVNRKHWRLDGTDREVRQEGLPVPLPSGKQLFRSMPWSWSVYLDAEHGRRGVYCTLSEAKAIVEREAEAAEQQSTGDN